jgi:hypothetical protein
MKIIATNDNLDLIDSYDLGKSSVVKGPDQDRFNRDITIPSDLQYMQYEEYIHKLQARTQEIEEKRKRDNRAGVIEIAQKAHDLYGV